MSICTLTFALILQNFSCLADGPNAYSTLYNAIKPIGPFELHLIARAVPVNPWRYRGDLRYDPPVVSELANGLYQSSWVSALPTQTIISSYMDFLNNSQWGRVPFSTQQQKDFDEITERLFDRKNGSFTLKPLYNEFLTLKSEYNSVLREWQETPEDRRSEDLERRLNVARSKVEDEKFRSLIPLTGRLRSLLSLDYGRLGRRAKERFKSNSDDARAIAVNTVLYPSFQVPVSAISWTPINLTEDGTAPEPASIPASLNSGWYVDDAGGKHAVAGPKQFKLRFDMASLEVSYPWMDEDALFGSGRRLWRFEDPTKQISDGIGIAQPIGPLSSIVRRLIIVRNIYIDAPFSLEIASALRDLKPNTTLNLGPLAIGGQFRTHDGDYIANPIETTAGELLIPGIQIVGVLSERITPATAFEGKTARGNLGWWWLRVRGRHGP
jgi:hypothetical protein